MQSDKLEMKCDMPKLKCVVIVFSLVVKECAETDVWVKLLMILLEFYADTHTIMYTVKMFA